MRFHFLRYLSLFLFLLVTAASAQAAEKRVLFIVETSKDTKALAEAERKLIGALIETGLGGLLEANDTFGIWTFDETLHVGKFPMQRWTPEGREQILLRTQDFLKMQPYVKAARMEAVWRPLESVVQDSPALMVVLVTSGKHSIKGTPYDAEINNHLKSASRDYQKKKMPAVVMLSSTSGKILRYSVNPAIGDVRIPVLTMPTNAAPVKIAQPAPQKSNPPPPIVATVPAPKSNTDAAFIITREGSKNVTRLEADQISTSNFDSVPNEEIPQVPVPKIPDIVEIKGPVILKHEVEEIRHEIAIRPPRSANPNDNISQPETPTQPPVVESTAVTTPAPIATAVPAPVESKPPAVDVAPATPPQAKVALAEIPKPAELEKPVAAVTPLKVVQPVEVPTAIIPQPKPEPPAIAPVITKAEPTTPGDPIKQVSSTTTTEAITAAPTTAAIPAEVTQPDKAIIPPQPLLAQSSPPPGRSLTFLIGAMGLIFVALILAFLVGRKMGTRPQQSLVSDWADRDRAKK